MTEQQTEMNPSDLAQLPTVFITLQPTGDVEFATNTQQMDPMTAIAMLEHAKFKLNMQHAAMVQAAKQMEARTKPKIWRPDHA